LALGNLVPPLLVSRRPYLLRAALDTSELPVDVEQRPRPISVVVLELREIGHHSSRWRIPKPWPTRFRIGATRLITPALLKQHFPLFATRHVAPSKHQSMDSMPAL